MKTSSRLTSLALLVVTLTVTGAGCSLLQKKTVSQANTNASTSNINQSNSPTESGCAQEGTIKSPASLKAAKITFDNQTTGDLNVYWINFTGAREFYSKLKANSTYKQDTWVGHVWVVTNNADTCVKLHSANAVEQTLVVK